ncbi:unnamed protein product [Lactuca virosa]|uniref:Uncharacterized protein n=1 Tax=Lactuca virosa TaxID=75947 RepID=A0AAU9MUS6_9ASTR|nr:unnamed protein product [Lactuca virosa]
MMKISNKKYQKGSPTTREMGRGGRGRGRSSRQDIWQRFFNLENLKLFNQLVPSWILLHVWSYNWNGMKLRLLSKKQTVHYSVDMNIFIENNF